MDAVDDLSDAIDATRNFLTPVRAGMWLKLSIVVLFVVGIGTGGPTLPGGDLGTFADDPGAQPEVDMGLEELPADFFLFLGIIAAALLLLWLLFAIIGAIMEFVFIESLQTTEVHVRRYTRNNLGRGIRLFGFRLVVSVLAASIVFGPAASVYLTTGTIEAVVEVALLTGLLGFVVYGLYAIVMRFTSEFVAPIMLLENRGVLSSWRRFWGTFTANWAEYVVYLLLAWILIVVAQIGVGFVLVLGGLLLAVPFVILGLLAFALGEVGLFLLIPIALLAVVIYALFYGIVWTPVRSYFQYYALLLLGDTNADLDLIPEQRGEIRSDGGEPTPESETERERGDDRGVPDGRWGADESETWNSDASDDDPWDWGDTGDRDDTDDRDETANRDDTDDRDDTDRGW